MSPEEAAAFWALHNGLPRQGPGEPGDVAWVARLLDLRPDARICDAGCGPGADLEALLAAAPEGRVTAIEKHADFVETAAARRLDRVDVIQGDMADISGAYDLIWAAGSLYFLGVTEGLRAWRAALAPGGAVAFSEPCWLTPDPPEELRRFWARYPALTDGAGIKARIEAAGYHQVGARILSDAAWEAYYGPMQDRLATLGPSFDLSVLDDARDEIRLWRRHSYDIGYLLSVVRPA